MTANQFATFDAGIMTVATGETELTAEVIGRTDAFEWRLPEGFTTGVKGCPERNVKKSGEKTWRHKRLPDKGLRK